MQYNAVWKYLYIDCLYIMVQHQNQHSHGSPTAKEEKCLVVHLLVPDVTCGSNIVMVSTHVYGE